MKALFDLHCHTDYPGSDMLGVYVFRFTDCIEACASWNSRRDGSSPQCLAVAYDTGSWSYTEAGGKGNCLSKKFDNITAKGTKGADAAVLQFDS